MVYYIATVPHFKRNTTVSVPTLILMVNSREFFFFNTVFIRPLSTLEVVVIRTPWNADEFL